MGLAGIALGTLGFFAGFATMYLLQWGWNWSSLHPAGQTGPALTFPQVLIVASIADVVFGICAFWHTRWAWGLGVLTQIALLVALMMYPTLDALAKIIGLPPLASLIYLISPAGWSDFGLTAHPRPPQ